MQGPRLAELREPTAIHDHHQCGRPAARSHACGVPLPFVLRVAAIPVADTEN